MRATAKAISAALAIAIAYPASPALAQDPEVHTDPDRGSPAGTLYEIPLERGRGDAAPLSGGAGTPSAPPAVAPASPIRSENGFGSSSQVPGTSPGEGGASASGTSGGGSGGDGAAAGEGGSSERRGSSTGETGRAGAGGDARAESVALAASTVTVSRSLLLLGLGAAVALMLGLAARWASARR